MPAMQRGGKQIGNFIRTYNDGDGTVAKRTEERASDVRGLRARDGGGITGFPPHVTAREGKGERMDMDGCSNGWGRAKDLSDRIPERRGKDLPSQRVPGERRDTGRPAATQPLQDRKSVVWVMEVSLF